MEVKTDYQTMWKKMFPVPLGVRWEDHVLVNEYCSRCRFCCGPQAEEEPFPMALLDSQISERTPRDFYLLDSHTASLDRRGCRSLDPESGCRLPRNLRPVACGFFPIVLVNMKLYVYRVCPASVIESPDTLRGIAIQIRDWLDTLPESDVRRISISREEDDLRAKYTDLELAVHGKAMM